MNRFLEDKKVQYGMFFLLFLLACIQNVSLFRIEDVQYVTLALKPVHLFSLAFLPLLLCQKKIRINKAVLLFVCFGLLISIINIPAFGLRSLNALYLFGLYIVFLCMNCGKQLTLDDWTDLACKAAGVVMLLVILKDIRDREGILWYLNTPGKEHPWIGTIVGGHINLESTWLGLFAFFFYKSRWKWVYAGLNLAISILYGSRCGMIVAGLAILWLLVPELSRLKERKFRIIAACLLVVCIALLVWSGVFENVILRAVSRFFSGGTDNGDRTRLEMWSHILQTSLKYPLGCGIGNSILAVGRVSGVPQGDSNLHNVYFQQLVDLGWIGGAAYCFLVLRLFWKGRKELLTNPFLASLAAYSVVALFQFRGGETLAFLILGIYLAVRDQNDEKTVWSVKNPLMHGRKGAEE